MQKRPLKKTLKKSNFCILTGLGNHKKTTKVSQEVENQTEHYLIAGECGGGIPNHYTKKRKLKELAQEIENKKIRNKTPTKPITINDNKFIQAYHGKW